MASFASVKGDVKMRKVWLGVQGKVKGNEMKIMDIKVEEMRG